MKRWTIRATVVAVSILSAVLGAASPSSATSGWKWTGGSDYGWMGQNLRGSGTTVDDVLADFVPPSRDFFTGHAWRFRITRYDQCDPRGKDRTSAGCPVDGHFEGKTRKGNPPQEGTGCASLTVGAAGISACRNFGLAQAFVSAGDFPDWGTKSKQFAGHTWLCTEIQKNTKADGSGTWNNIGGGSPTGKGVRACAEVF